MSSEKFCLKWNDFESNISSAFCELRNDAELFDVTLACEDDEQMPAHKLVLSACSTFFRSVLRRCGGQQNQQLMLYLRGVTARDMSCVLEFMYHGEVSVAQDDLNTFLQVAEDLKVKGLTQGNSEGGGGGTKSQSARNPSSAPVSNSSRSYVKRPPPPPQSSSYQSQHYAQAPADDDIQEVTPVVKTEAAAVSSASVAAGGGYGAEEGGGGVMAEYEDTYGDYGDPGYGDQEYDTSMMDQDQGMADKIPCPVCNVCYHKSSLKRHIKNQHEGAETASCSICGLTLKNEGVLKDHMRRKHNAYQTF